MKEGDFVYQIERHISIPGGEWKWSAKIIKIEPSYIEVEYERDRNLQWLNDLVKKLAPNHRTFEKQHHKNYYDSTGKINIQTL